MDDFKFDSSKELLPGEHIGSPARPELEKLPDTTATAEEVSPAALDKSPDDGAHILSGSTSLEESSFQLIRPTPVFRIEPWRLLGLRDPRDHDFKKCGGASVGCKACLLLDDLKRVQYDCAMAANLMARACERMDGEIWEQAKREAKGEKPVFPKKLSKVGAPTVAWPSDDWNGYQAGREAAPDVLSGIMSAVARMVTTKWRRERWDILARCERAAARYRTETMPIPLRAADVKLVETESRDVFLLQCSLTSGRDARGKQWSIPIKAKDQKQYKALHEIVTEQVKMGSLLLKRDRLKKHWELRINYKKRIERPTGHVLGAINRGIACVIAVATETGKHIIYEGYDIEAFLKQMEGRRKRYQYSFVVSGRKGRGRNTALKPTFVLEGQAERWRTTRMQTIASEVSKFLVSHGVTEVLFDDLEGIRDGAVENLVGGELVWQRIQTWPYYQMGQHLKSAVEAVGIKVAARPCEFGSRDCPKCGRRHDLQLSAHRIFRCEEEGCGFVRHVDVTLGLNLIGREQLRLSEGKEAPLTVAARKAARKAAKRKKMPEGGGES